MAESYYRAFKYSSNTHRRENTKSKTHIDNHHNNKHKMEIECKTPPLPAKSSNIDDLLKKRDLLKEELEKINNHSNSGKCKGIKNNSKGDQRLDHSVYKQSRKRHGRSDKKKNIKIKKTRMEIVELSPVNINHVQLESEDEESIIENRRKQRKQLIEKFNIPWDDKNTEMRNVTEHCKNKPNLKRNATNNTKTSEIKETVDMFSDKDESADKKVHDSVKQDDIENMQLTDNWDDEDGYYNIKVGDIINQNKYTIKSKLGQGVFANVVRAQDLNNNIEVAIKIIRNNDLMYKTGLKEIAILKAINDADPDDKYHCVKFLGHFTHKGHLCMIIEPMYMDMRSIIKKYGKNHGLNMKALMNYSRQLLLALILLKRINVIHCDIKPDNILVNEKKNLLKLCDFGSACKVDENEPTPYLVSRFYRAPEIILGIPYNYGVDMWSTACTIFEMATGKIMFTGSSNNKMLKCFMDLKGKISTRLIRKGKFKDQHFNYNNNFLLHKKDDFSGREKLTEVSSIHVTRDLLKDLKKTFKSLTVEEEKKMSQLKDLLEKMTTLDASQRISILDSLKHPFIQE